MTPQAALSAFGIGVFAASANHGGILWYVSVEGAERCAEGACWETATMAKAHRDAVAGNAPRVIVRVPQNISLTPSCICRGGPADVI